MEKVGGMNKLIRGLGLGLLLLGTILLPLNLWGVEGLGLSLPLSLMILGGWLIYRCLFHEGRAHFLFNGTLMVSVGILSLLIRYVFPADLDVTRLWPLFTGAVGLSLIPYAHKSTRKYRVSLMIPAIILIFLSVVFLFFSLDLVQVSLAEFVSRWWPLVVLFFGLIFLAVYYQKQHLNSVLVSKGLAEEVPPEEAQPLDDDGFDAED